MYIYRELQDYFDQKITPDLPFGFILSGIVGCGKTTLVEKLLNDLKTRYEIFRFTGDDIQFRKSVAEDSRFILKTVISKTTRQALVFVDEIQKSEEIFDALKIAFDSKKISFIVSGSNPAYLSTVAKKRLQRRAEQVFMLPLSMPEILISKNLVSIPQTQLFSKLLFSSADPENLQLAEFSLTDAIKMTTQDFINSGGLPLAYLSESFAQKMAQIRLTVERGFDLLSVENNSSSELIKLELANLHSKEFTYQNIINKTQIRRRDEINKVIDDLINHGYLVKKKPVLLTGNRSSYLSVFSYVDPGMVTYLRGGIPENEEIGCWLEGYIHSRLDYMTKNNLFKSELGYFKPHTVDSNKKIKYLPGEVDFVLIQNKKLLPIEVKLTDQISKIDTTEVSRFLNNFKEAKFGIILYGGIPYWDAKDKLLYWPYWLV